jgi:hypothetical protein
MYLGGADFAWVSDYSQIYLIDSENSVIVGIEDVPTSDMEHGFHVAANALVVYTVDCLRQTIRITLYDAAPLAKPQEIMSEDAWTKVIETVVTFPSGSFTISSPSKSGTENYGPHFKAPAKKLNARVSWLEYQDDRYDAFRIKPDVIQIELWPA